MKRIGFGFVFVLSILCTLTIVTRRMVHAQNGNDYIRGYPGCGKEVYDNDMFVVENICDGTMSIDWTSAGSVWGRAQSLGPGGHQGTGNSRDDVNEAGGVDLYTCARGFHSCGHSGETDR